MNERLCLRCDWAGKEEGAACPKCGALLYRLGAPGSAKRKEAVPSAASRPVRDPGPASALEAIGIDEGPAARDTSPGKKTTVIVVAFTVAAIGMIGSLMERTAPDVPSPEAADRPEAAAPSIVGGATGPSSPAAEPGPDECLPGSPSRVPVRTPIEGESATLTADYRFRETLSSSVGQSPDLVAAGSGPVRFIGDDGLDLHRTVLGFGPNGGLSLPSASDVVGEGGYSVEVLFRFDRLNGYRKILDFEDGGSDDGLYSLDGCLSFYPRVTADHASIVADRYVHVVLTRYASSRVIGYVNGVRVFAFADTAGRAVVDDGEQLRFFTDDDTTTSESSGGAVARVRVYDGPIGDDRVRALCAALLPEGCGPSTEE